MTDQETFKKIIESYPNLSTYVAFSKLVKGRKFAKIKIQKLFNELVDKEDYSKGNKEFLLEQLNILSNG